MKKKILDLAKSAVWLVLIFIIGVIGFRISFSLGTPHEKEEFNIKIFTKKGHDYLLVDTKHGVCVIHAESCHCRLDTLGIYVVDNKDTTYVIKKK